MCLSSVYNQSRKAENLLCKNIADVKFIDGKLVLTDIIGIKTVLDATLERIDLTDNFIIVNKG